MTVTDVNRQSYCDEDQLIWATEQERVIYSYNRRDFCRLHSEFLGMERNHTGIVLLQQQRYSVGQQLQGLLKLVATLSAEEMACILQLKIYQTIATEYFHRARFQATTHPLLVQCRPTSQGKYWQQSTLQSVPILPH